MASQGCEWRAALAEGSMRPNRGFPGRRAQSDRQLHRTRGRYEDPFQHAMLCGVHATGRLGCQTETETSIRTGTTCPRRNPKCMTVTKTSLRSTARRWS